jgi:transcription factor SOX4/11/12 (SOX group C)
MAQQNDLAEPEANQRISRPRNAFILYSNENRRRVSALNPNLDNREISRILGTLWRQLSRDQQYPYWRRASEERRLHKRIYPGL